MSTRYKPRGGVGRGWGRGKYKPRGGGWEVHLWRFQDINVQEPILGTTNQSAIPEWLSLGFTLLPKAVGSARGFQKAIRNHTKQS